MVTLMLMIKRGKPLWFDVRDIKEVRNRPPPSEILVTEALKAYLITIIINCVMWMLLLLVINMMTAMPMTIGYGMYNLSIARDSRDTGDTHTRPPSPPT